MAPEIIALFLVLVGLTAYALLAGADFGAGIWEVNTALLSSPKERALLYGAIGPVWEANHVWLIFVLVMLFGAFPAAFAAVCQALWLPLTCALAGIVFRGIGFAFRSYSVGAARQEFAWHVVFAVGSVAAPFFLGVSIGAIASGRLAVAASGTFDGNYLSGWMSPLALFMGFFVVGVCAYLAAVFMAREASSQGEHEQTLIWRQRALATGIWMGVLALAGVGYVAIDAPLLWQGFRAHSWPLVGGSVAAGFLSLDALVRERFRVAVAASALAVVAVIWGWAVAQYPYLVPPSITIEDSKAPDRVLWFLIATTAAGAVLLVPALGYLLYLFKAHRQAG
ncbi:MAG: cytochrome d ubiquinol oxidase subunit II [Pirellulales bacterium]